MNRALRAATLGVLLFSPLALSACSAGQVTQTAEQVRDQRGTMAEVGDLTLRAINVASPDGGAYEAGDDASLQVAIVNDGDEDDTLTDVSGEGFDEAVIGTSAAVPGTAAGSDELEIPADEAVLVGVDDPRTITLVGLDESLTTGGYVELTFTFENAGEVTVATPVAASAEVLEREEFFDFHHEEH
ncbi:copper chaperone PCu(A)C [Blastococcus sp. BMG 814]|uniref:Copper chaperone PCu(A)C n=1 Tax=Blastococcus carthaginiensis TaxID=3050034 RepID=A0ABT9II14_9ACTN|nr:copper chaperone PCu(A)C [Blastococcus carthaginiensis]MDP5185224.1 copper chaperone PCu(A)C [Blastococcus carthaginiensis]